MSYRRYCEAGLEKGGKKRGLGKVDLLFLLRPGKGSFNSDYTSAVLIFAGEEAGRGGESS